MTTLQIMAREFQRATTAVASVVEKSSISTVLRATEIEFAGGQATFSATDKNQHVRVTVAGDGEGKILLDAAALDAKVRMLRPDDPVTIEIDAVSATIKQGRTRWKMPVIAGELPGHSEVKSKPVSFSGTEFLSALSTAAIAAPEDDARAWINGVLLDGNTMVGTNGYFLSTAPIDLKKIPRITIPTPSCRNVSRLFKSAGELQVKANDSHVVIESDGLEYSTRLLGDKFPEWQRMIPANFENYFTADASALLATVGRATNIEQTGKSGNAIRIEAGNGEVGISTSNINGEVGEDFCAAEIVGDIPPVGCFGRFLMPALQSFEGKVRVYVIDGNSPIRIDQEANPKSFRIVMPVRMAG